MPVTVSRRAQIVPQVKISPPENLVLDNLVARPAATFNLRRTTRHYDGAMVTVRGDASSVPRREFRSDIRGELDIRALLAFVGNGSGFVDRWNNPNNSSLYAVQATAANQPTIVNAGVLGVTQNAKPTINFNGSNHFFNIVNPLNTSSNTIFIVTRLTKSDVNAGGGTYLLGSNTPTGLFGFDNEVFGVRFLSTSGGYFPVAESAAQARNVLRLYSLDNIANTANLFVNGTIQSASVSIGTEFQPTIISGYLVGSRLYGGDMSEIILFNQSLNSQDRQLIERDQAKYFSITGVR